MPKVSIITPCYNGERFLKSAIESVRAQGLTDWELVIVDDGSKDRSAEIAGEFAASDARIRVVRQPNQGVNAARNAGFREASESAYVLFLDGDDLLDQEMLAIMAGYLDSHPDVGMAFCRYRSIDEDGKAVQDQRCELPRYTCDGGSLRPLPCEQAQTPFDTAFWWIDLPIMSALMRRTVYERLPGWDETLRQGFEDTDLLLRFFLAGHVHAVQQILVSYRKHAAQATRNGWRMKRRRGALHENWLAGAGLTEEEAARFRAQWKLYEGSILPRYLLSEARANFAQREFARSAKLAVRAAAHRAIAGSVSFRRIVWPCLWYLA